MAGNPMCFARTRMVAVLLMVGLPGGPAAAQDLPRESVLPLQRALEAASAALAKCRADGYQVTVAVVDRGGDLKALLRGDGAGPHTQDSSFKKAYTSASMRRPTAELAGLIVEQPQAQALRDMNDRILILGGGLPVAFDGDVVGGIGVGGAPGGHLDEDCARAGLDAIGADAGSE